MAYKVIDLILRHPITIQYPVNLISDIASEYSKNISVTRIPKGRWVLQYGFKFPSILTPINPYRLLIDKPAV